jgi:hypothetical protein
VIPFVGNRQSTRPVRAAGGVAARIPGREHDLADDQRRRLVAELRRAASSGVKPTLGIDRERRDAVSDLPTVLRDCSVSLENHSEVR